MNFKSTNILGSIYLNTSMHYINICKILERVAHQPHYVKSPQKY